ncbi:UDP-N-acetylglucosamine--dolichyl-phosphate N-acetylglucosaminephosphotransferase [Orchesella cincta]|uniref:UDP-N-acetylglucosamine--dolichyl-phosphate N-acetylglucosaminephosphotransferase n=1 Tax=Orchesella cincta TaxID=48709 RepID=A0A1D2M9N1_ORCCI|nr:UDP-N-acetylglucosamine--dolichyl-phosphate N-acetylglucosaminephosphotransferase [Orchesella cincta]
MTTDLWCLIFLSIGAYLITSRIIPRFRDVFIRANLFGIDLCKSTGAEVPEAVGVFVWMCISGMHVLIYTSKLVEYITALLGVTCILLLGFADDVLDVPWRVKLLLPAIAALPMLLVYYATFDITFVVVPKPLRPFVGQSIDLGWLYYVYMMMVVVFSTNAINILAGINGLECGQTVVIALSVLSYNCFEIYMGEVPSHAHYFSVHLLLPFIGTSAALLRYNWYPAQVFVGDTYCYFSGMLFATIGILGHFSKTLLLFFIPQVINFVYSVPQIFHFVPCPRHRLPRYNKLTNNIEMSTVRFKQKDLKFLGRASISILESMGLLAVQRNVGENREYTECNNFTLVNLILKLFGPMHERSTTIIILLIQILCSCAAFAIRYPLARLFYDV